MPEPVFTAIPVTTFMGQPRPLFVYFHSFQAQVLEKNL